MATSNKTGDSAASVFGYQYQEGVAPTQVHAYDLKYEREAQKKILLEMEMKDRKEQAAVVEDGTAGYLFGDGSEGPSAGNEEGPFAYDIEYERKMQSKIDVSGSAVGAAVGAAVDELKPPVAARFMEDEDNLVVHKRKEKKGRSG